MPVLHSTYLSAVQSNDANDCREILKKLKDNWNLVKNPTPEQLAKKNNPYYNYESERYQTECVGFWSLNPSFKPNYNPGHNPRDKPGSYETAEDLMDRFFD